jgi:RNase H-fold protein (predicted Holliday junction resolvase)
MKTVLAIDPGRMKCGLAVVANTTVLYRGVLPKEVVVSAATSLAHQHSVEVVIVGSGTGGPHIANVLRISLPSIPVELVDESGSTLRARAKFFEENPPKGIWRLIPRGLLIPPRPYDDYVAQILAEDFIRSANPS